MLTLPQSRVWILDVGHGNSTVVESPGHVSVIDGGRQGSLLSFLAERKITFVDTVIVSHVDADHLGGISLLLSDPDFQVGQVYINPDESDTDLWKDFGSVMEDAKKRNTKFHLELTKDNPGQITYGRTRLEVLAPLQELAYKTTNSRSPEGKLLNSNAMSAVVRVWADDSPRVLLAGDIEQVGLDFLIEGNSNIRADVLVFPHHGGRPGVSDPEHFAKKLILAVGARLVVFSIGRGKYNTPRPDIIDSVLNFGEDTHVACTQLSERCAFELPEEGMGPCSTSAQAVPTNKCCAGTLEISLESNFTYKPARSAHIDFIDQSAPTALCRR